MLIKFYEALCLAAISNTDYEGDIKRQGDKVIIRTVPTVTVSDYSKNQELDFEYLESPNEELLIDKARSFAFLVDDIDLYQTDLNLLSEFSSDAGEQMKISIETAVFADIYPDAATYNEGATAGYIDRDINLGTSGAPLAVSTSDVLALVVNAMSCLNQYNVPKNDRWGVIPDWMNSHILLSELKDASLAGDGTSILRNGRIGRIADCTLYTSNLLTSATDGAFKGFYAMFGQKRALSFAAQLTKVERVSPSKSFQKGVKGLNVYGYKVLKPEALVVAYVRKG